VKVRVRETKATSSSIGLGSHNSPFRSQKVSLLTDFNFLTVF
jgi:hypothetical protein